MYGAFKLLQKGASLHYPSGLQPDYWHPRVLSDVGLTIFLQNLSGRDTQFAGDIVYVLRVKQDILTVDAALAAHGTSKAEGVVRPDLQLVKIVSNFF